VNARRTIAALAAGVALATATPHALSADITGLPPAGVGMRRGDYPDTTVTGEIAGVVRNGATGQPIAFANVIVIGTKLGAMTDDSGRFSIVHVPVGTRSLLVASVGFERERRDVIVAARQAVDVSIVLREPSDGPIVAFETPDSSVLDIIRRAKDVHVYRLDTTREPVRFDTDRLRPTHDPENLGDWWIAVELPRPSDGWTREFKRLLTSASSYRSGLAPVERCQPAAELGVRFRSGEDLVFVEVGTTCGKVQFQSTIAPTSRGTLGPAGRPLVDLIEQALAAPPEYSWTSKPFGFIYGRVVGSPARSPRSTMASQAIELRQAGLRTVTDDQGRFAFTHVPVGTWQVAALCATCDSTGVRVTVRAGEASRPMIVVPDVALTTGKR